jgi:hypothetical protein
MIRRAESTTMHTTAAARFAWCKHCILYDYSVYGK